MWFGDVWVCAGQSNMMITMDYIMNATEEIAASRDYTNIKMAKAYQATSPEPQDDLIGGIWPGWYTTADSGRLDLGGHLDCFRCHIKQIFTVGKAIRSTCGREKIPRTFQPILDFDKITVPWLLMLLV